MENRFLEMDNRLKRLQKNNRSQSLTARKNQGNFAGAFEAISYTVPGLVAPLRQPSGMVCWATVTTMMISWRRQQSLSIETAIGDIGQTWLQKFRNNQGLAADEKIPFLQAAGFQFEYPQSLSIVGWEQILRQYGPIWVTTDEDPSVGFAIHARIMSAIRGDGTPDNTFLTITDPARGNQYQEKFSDFLRKYEDEVRTSGDNWSGRIQIVHWPQATAAFPQSLSNEPVVSRTISAQGIAMIKRFEGFRSSLYNDPVGHCSVGYGELVHRGNCNNDASEQPYRSGISEEAATQLLVQRLHNFERQVNEQVTVALNQNQFDSLVSFTYNVGSANLRQSTLLRVLNQGNYAAVPAEMRRWTKGRINGQLVDLPGLVSRRNDEANLFAGTSGTSGSQSWTGNYAFPFTASRGMRNNNPGNIQINNRNNWEGKVPPNENTDGRFEQFTSFSYGVRALIILLTNYIRSDRSTLRKIAESYAPASENDTVAYSRFLASRLNVNENTPLPLTRNNLRLLVQAIARMENGQECVTDTQFDEAWSLVPDNVRSNAQTVSPGFMSVVFEDTNINDLAASILQYTQRVSMSPAIRSQFEQIRQSGNYALNGATPFVPSLSILGTIKNVMEYSINNSPTANPAFGILSFIRPNSSHHSNGTAVDLSVINGRRIDVRNQQEALEGILACIRNLAPGNYAFGLPRPPRTTPQEATTDRDRYRHLNLYDNNNPPALLPQYQDLPQTHFFLGAEYNEHYVPGGINGGLSHINNANARSELTNAVNEASQRGAFVRHLMADALDHLHIQAI